MSKKNDQLNEVCKGWGKVRVDIQQHSGFLSLESMDLMTCCKVGERNKVKWNRHGFGETSSRKKLCWPFSRPHNTDLTKPKLNTPIFKLKNCNTAKRKSIPKIQLKQHKGLYSISKSYSRNKQKDLVFISKDTAASTKRKEPENWCSARDTLVDLRKRQCYKEFYLEHKSGASLQFQGDSCTWILKVLELELWQDKLCLDSKSSGKAEVRFTVVKWAKKKEHWCENSLTRNWNANVTPCGNWFGSCNGGLQQIGKAMLPGST